VVFDFEAPVPPVMVVRVTQEELPVTFSDLTMVKLSSTVYVGKAVLLVVGRTILDNFQGLGTGCNLCRII